MAKQKVSSAPGAGTPARGRNAHPSPAATQGHTHTHNAQSDRVGEQARAAADDVAAASDRTPWYLTFSGLAAIMVAARVAGSSLYLLITDCDETFNYWEPTHYMLYGTGQQTWEYAPQYALRSYAYTGIHAVLALLAGAGFGVDKITVFHAVRALLAAICGLCEAYFVTGLRARFGNRLAALTAGCLLASAGMLHAAPAFLPSSFTMYWLMLSWGGWLRGRSGYWQFVNGLAGGLVLGWPFAIVALVPFGLHVMLVYPFFALVKDGLMAVLNAVGLCVLADIVYYRRFLVAPWNIILYNAFGVGGGGQGSDLYGVEPASFYAKNIFLNFPGLALLAAASPLVYVVAALGPTRCRRMLGAQRTDATLTRALPAWTWQLALMGQLWLWFVYMSARPHKEERFMFIVFPLIAYAAAFTLNSFIALFDATSDAQRAGVAGGDTRKQAWPTVIVAVMVLACSAGSAARIGALVHGYSAPMAAWTALARHVSADANGALHAVAEPGRGAILRRSEGIPGSYDSFLAGLASNAPPPPRADAAVGVRVCVGKEWYRFPATFFLAERTRAGVLRGPLKYAGQLGGPAELRYLKSAFTGLLPQPYLSVNGSSAIRGGFNDENREEPDRYVDPLTCDFIVDYELPTPRHTQDAKWEPWFDQPVIVPDASCASLCRGDTRNSRWISVWRGPFLHAESSPLLTRAFYLPGYSVPRNVYGQYHVLQRVDCDCGKPA